MKNYEVIGNYILFKEINVDLLGKNYRAGQLNEDGGIKEHTLFTEVYPFFYKNKDVWKRVELLLNGVKKSKISHLYSPNKIINNEKKFLVYPYLEGVSLEKILDDSIGKNIPVNFDLALSISIGIADLLDAGSSIAVSGKRSFHGFLTPDNVIVDHDGNIWIKNYGVYAYLNGTEDVHKELIMKYGAWLTPEFVRKEKPLPQSDIYHLGYIIYKMITGTYFSHSEGEDFDSKVSNISFLQHITTSDKGFLDNIILFFKKTLNPNPQKRFANIREFKEFISNNFNIEELSSVTFNIAYFMSSLYGTTIDSLEKETKEELKYIIPSKLKENNVKEDTDIVENLLSGLDNHEKSKSKNKFYLIGAILTAVIIVVYMVLSMKSNTTVEVNKAKTEVSSVKLEDSKKAIEIKNLKKKLAAQKLEIELSQKKAEEAKQASIDLENKIKDEKDAEKKKQLKLEQDKQNKIIEEEKKKADARLEEERIKKEQELVDEKKRLVEKEKEEARLKEEARKNALKTGDMVLNVDKKPVEINTEIPELSKKLRKKITGKSIIATVSVIVDQNGRVKKIKFIKKTGIPEIDMELSRIINLWKFEPAIKYGKKVSTWFTKVVTIKK